MWVFSKKFITEKHNLWHSLWHKGEKSCLLEVPRLKRDYLYRDIFSNFSKLLLIETRSKSWLFLNWKRSRLLHIFICCLFFQFFCKETISFCRLLIIVFNFLVIDYYYLIQVLINFDCLLYAVIHCDYFLYVVIDCDYLLRVL